MIKMILLPFVIIIACFVLFFTFNKKPETTITPAIPETSRQNPVASPDIIVDYPKPNDIVKSPLVVKGKARGGWYFEGDFPVTLYYGVKDEWVESYATAKGEWMTENYVDFEVTLEFPAPYANDGLLVLRKNNPSDIKELNAEISIPVKF